MAAGIVLLTALMILATQLMMQGRTGEWPSITIASAFNVPDDRVLSDWINIDKPIHFILYDTQLWIVLLFTAALIYWLTDWMSEKLGLTAKCAPPPEPRRERDEEKSELADSGTSP